jgi:hypothetical protein
VPARVHDDARATRFQAYFSVRPLSDTNQSHCFVAVVAQAARPIGRAMGRRPRPRGNHEMPFGWNALVE